jgi:L-aminoadipate-semialdehyde dehydrogenase
MMAKFPVELPHDIIFKHPTIGELATAIEVLQGNREDTVARMTRIWTQILPATVSPIPVDESFFDLGGHSITATRLLFEIQQVFKIDASLDMLLLHPSILQLSK